MSDKRKLLSKILYFGLIGLFALVFVASAIYVGGYFLDSGVEADKYGDLSNLVASIRNELDMDDPTSVTDPSLPDGTTPTVPGVTSAILPEYQAIYEMNNDLVGWIKIPDTKVDYPVMQTSLENKDYYLYRNFEGVDPGTGYRPGCLYVRELCNVFTPSDNVVIYGHNMKDGSMFGDLDKFYNKEFWETHQTFTFDTLYERHTYQIIAVFKTTATLGEGFAYHQFNEAANEAEFRQFINTVKSKAWYDTGVTAEYGDMLLSLSTCEYSTDNGRFVVVAKRIS